MSRGVEDIMSRLDDVAPTPRRVDRDARRALLAVAAVTTVFAGLALMATPAGSDPEASATSGSEAASTDLLGAFERLSVPAHEEARPKDESSSFPATSPPSAGYESIEAMAPGRRT